MTKAFAIDNKMDTASIEKISQDSLNGDISIVMRVYEEELKAPLKNLVFGKLSNSKKKEKKRRKVQIIINN